MPYDEETYDLKTAVDDVRNLPSRCRIFASLVTGRDIDGYRLYFAYSTGSRAHGLWSPENSGGLVREFFSFDTEIIEETGRVLFRGQYQGVDQRQEPFVADHGYQELTGAIKATFLEQHMILQLVRNVQKVDYSTLFWLVDHGVKVFYEYVDLNADVLIEEYMLPAVPPP